MTIDLYNGDCLEVIQELIDKGIKVDAVITDPPYEFNLIGGKGKGELADRQRERNKTLINMKLHNGFDFKVLDLLCKLMKKINIYIFCSKNQIYKILNYFEDKDVNFDFLCWHKLNPSPLANMTYLNDTEYILNFREKGCIIRGKIEEKKKYFLTAVNQKDKKEFLHPTIKPLSILNQLIINSTEAGDLVLDCFMGSGTTGLACKMLNRNFIGIEINKKYFDIAKNRIESLLI